MPKGRSNCSNLLILRRLWRVDQASSVVNEEPGSRRNPTRSQTGLSLRLVSGVCTLGLIRGFLPRPH